jgi:hypothetical protein
MRRRFWVGCGCFFLGETGEEKRRSRVRVAEKFSQDERALSSPVCVTYYMLSSGGFTTACLQTIAKGGSSILGCPEQTCAMFQFQASTTGLPVHTLTTVEGLLHSFLPGLHGTVGMIFYAHVVYVVICYVSIICYMSVICLVQIPPQEAVVVVGYIEGPFLVSRTGCGSERHAPCIEGPVLLTKNDPSIVCGTRNYKLGG